MITAESLYLNESLAKANVYIYRMLSATGLRAYFPKSGIMAQADEIKGKTDINATLGIIYDNGVPFHLPVVDGYITNLSPEEVYPYVSPAGVLELRKAWQQKIYKTNPGFEKPISLPVVTPGLTGALSVAADLFLGPRDVLLLPSPYWSNYDMIFGIKHVGQVDYYNVFSSDLTFTLDFLREKLLRYTVLSLDKIIVLLNFPHNPTGYMPSIEEAEEIASFLIEFAETRKPLVVIFDDAYEGFVYTNEAYKHSFFFISWTF